MSAAAAAGAAAGGLAYGIATTIAEAFLSDFVDAISDYVRTEIGIRLGAVYNWSAEAFDGLVEEEPDSTVGMSPSGMMHVLERFLRATAQIGLLIGSEVAEELFMELIQEGFSNAIQTSLGGAFQSILNVWRGGSPPSPDELEAIVGKVVDLDEDTLALLIAMSGCNLPTTYYRVSRGFDLYVDEETRIIREQLIDVLNRANYAISWLYESCRNIAIDQLTDAVHVIRESYSKGINLLDEIAERSLSRLQELRVEVETANFWLDYTKQHPEMPIITEEEVAYVAIENLEEAKATYETYESIKRTVETTLAKIDVSLDEIISAIDSIIAKYVEHLNQMTEAGAINVDEEMTKLNNALQKVIAYRNAVDSSTSMESPVSGESFGTGIFVPTTYSLLVHVEY